MQRIINKPYLIFWFLIPIMLLIGKVRGTDMIDINIHDTYFVITESQSWYLVSILFGIIGLGYWIMIKFKRRLSKILNSIHIVLTVLGFLAIWVSRLIFTDWIINSDDPLHGGLATFNLIRVILILLIIGGQLIYLINLTIALIRKPLTVI